MPEVLDHFIPLGNADPLWDLKAKALRELRVATGGQLYPFVVTAKHLLEPERAEHLSNVSAYLTSKNFYDCDDYLQLRRRCHSLSKTRLDALSCFLFAKDYTSTQFEQALKSGLLIDTKFVSPLSVQEVFRELVKGSHSTTEITLDFSDQSTPLAEQIICAGLADMSSLDFDEADFSRYLDRERGLAFRWGICAGLALKEQVWQSSPLFTEDPHDASTMDFSVNGNVILSLGLAKDRTNEAVLDKFKKIRPDSFLLHFVHYSTLEAAMEDVKMFPAAMQSRVYTFMKPYNCLLCGTNIVRSGVVRKLPTPSAMYSACVTSSARWPVVR